MPSLTRTVLAAVVGCGLAAGCGKPAGPAKPARANAVAGDAGGTAPEAGTDLSSVAKEFLAAVHAGTARPEQLTAAFKRVIAEPVFPSDREKGYSDAAAADWLAGFKGQLPNPPGGSNGDNTVLYTLSGVEPVGTGRGIIAVRLVNGGSGWQADWLVPAEGVMSAGNGSVSVPHEAAKFAVNAFVLAVLARGKVSGLPLAEGMMTDRAKAALAPPLGADPRGFNRTLLHQRLSDLRGPFTGYAVDRVTDTAAEVTLTGPGGAKKKLTLTLARGDKPWEYRVDEIRAD